MATLTLSFRGYEAAKIPVSNQIFYLLPELYAIVRSVPVVPMELTIPRVISFGRICPHLGRPSQKLFMLYLVQELRYSGCQGCESLS